MNLKPYLIALGIGAVPLASEAESKPQVVQNSLEQEVSQICHDYDKEILKEMAFVNNALRNVHGYDPFTETDARFARALLLKEGRGYAWNHDPAQVSNKGDKALSEFKKSRRKGILGLINDSYFDGFDDVSHAPRRKGKWNYNGTGITPELSIRGMWFWLAQNNYTLHRSLKYDPGTKQHTVVKGDSIWKLAPKYGLLIRNDEDAMGRVTRLFQSWNPGVNLNKLRPGQVLNYRTATEWVWVGPESREDMLDGYNGGGHESVTGDSYYSGILKMFKITGREPFLE